MKNVERLFNELRSRDVKKSKRGTNSVIKQTDSRKIKREFMAAMLMDVRELLQNGEFAGVDSNGLVIEIMNESVDAITFEVNPKVKNLDYDAFKSVVLYKQDLQMKAERKEQRKRDKAAEFKYAQERRAILAKRKKDKE
jgi:hypothetical protein